MDKKISQQIAFWIFRVLGILVIVILFWILGFIIYNGIGVISWEFLSLRFLWVLCLLYIQMNMLETAGL